VAPEHFQSWIDWAKERGLGLDFNPTYFSHPSADDGFTLSHRDEARPQFWIEHGIACRKIGADMGRAARQDVITNVWIPDGSKDTPVDRKARASGSESLDAIFKEPIDPAHNLDAVESSSSASAPRAYVVGSHEFYLGYATPARSSSASTPATFTRPKPSPTKSPPSCSSCPGLLLHVSRGVRWDSDHVVLFDDPTRAIMEEVVRGGYLPRTHIGLDFFDASINRVAAWVIGARNAQKCLLAALLEPSEELRRLEDAGDFSGRLARMEEDKTLPLGAVWAEFCRRELDARGRPMVSRGPALREGCPRPARLIFPMKNSFKHVNYLVGRRQGVVLDPVGRLVYRSNLLGDDQRITNSGRREHLVKAPLARPADGRDRRGPLGQGIGRRPADQHEGELLLPLPGQGDRP
jgi:L-rhamnose isomerase